MVVSFEIINLAEIYSFIARSVAAASKLLKIIDLKNRFLSSYLQTKQLFQSWV